MLETYAKTYASTKYAVIEDTGDKIRRNLVVASFLIIASSWLQVPLHDLLGKLLNPTSPVPIVGWRLWSVVLLVLLYFGWRFWFAPMTRVSFRKFRQAIEVRKHNAVTKFLTDAIARSGSAGCPDWLKEPLAQLRAERAREGVEPLVSLSRQVPSSLWAGQLEVDLHFDRSVVHNSALVNYLVPERTQRRITAISLAGECVASDNASEFLFPIFVGALALVIVLWQLMKVICPLP